MHFMFSFDTTDKLQEVLAKLAKKDPKRAQIINKKIKEIVSNDVNTIEHYKNLKHEFAQYKRVHIDNSFVLFFQVWTKFNKILSALEYKNSNTMKKEKHIVFVRLEHHDDAYRR